MAKRAGQLKLGAFLYATGHHVAAWRHPDTWAGDSFRHHLDFARIVEAAKFDMVFIADNPAIRLDRGSAPAFTAHSGLTDFEPLTLLSALAVVTERVGLVATASTSYFEPFNLARQFASIDNLSGGRAGWNLVTTSDPSAALNFGHTSLPPHAERYARAEEFVDVVKGLWDSFDDDAFERDRLSGRYYDAQKLHLLNHKGQFFNVRGPLNAPRSVQGRPVIVQAGSSEAGQELAARTAEVVFTAQPTIESARAFYADLKGRMPRHDRSADDLKIMPGFFPVVGRTKAEAEDKFAALQKLVSPEAGLGLLFGLTGAEIDITSYPLDGPLPDLGTTNNNTSRQAVMVEMARRENLSIRDLYLRAAGPRGHFNVIGTADDIVDEMQARFDAYAADGFNLLAPTIPGGLTDFIELVLPELRRRGLFRTDYDGRTLRDHLGLRRPARGDA